ncbi:transcriptional and immune response regulator-like [Callorhinchus milii]|nr:transcriptional and immune response regulator-like [Callorhinchus milii]
MEPEPEPRPRGGPRRVSPSVYGQRFDSALRKKAAADIFQDVDRAALQRLFQRSGDKAAEERAHIVTIPQDSEDTARALTALGRRKREKLLQLLRAGRRSVKIP